MLKVLIDSAFLISFTSSTQRPEISFKSGNFLDSARFFKNKSLSGLSILVIEFLNSPLVCPDTCLTTPNISPRFPNFKVSFSSNSDKVFSFLSNSSINRIDKSSAFLRSLVNFL